jgi:membrane-associated protease RseP (regulator of RpoE activity)
VAQRFAPLVGLPPGARVVEVNEQPIGSAEDALAFIDTQLGQGIAIRLTLEGAPEAGRVYLMPQAEGGVVSTPPPATAAVPGGP